MGFFTGEYTSNSKPSRDFDEKYQTNFSKQWLLPGTLTSNRLWDLAYIWRRTFKGDMLYNITLPLCNEIVKLNSCEKLMGIDFLMGVASEFDEDDIAFYMKTDGMANKSSNYKKLINSLNKKYPIFWVPSLNKLEIIKLLK